MARHDGHPGNLWRSYPALSNNDAASFEYASFMRKVGCVFTIDCQKYMQFFLSRGDRQMTEIFVSGTEVFSDAKMTETSYE